MAKIHEDIAFVANTGGRVLIAADKLLDATMIYAHVREHADVKKEWLAVGRQSILTHAGGAIKVVSGGISGRGFTADLLVTSGLSEKDQVSLISCCIPASGRMIEVPATCTGT